MGAVTPIAASLLRNYCLVDKDCAGLYNKTKNPDTLYVSYVQQSANQLTSYLNINKGRKYCAPSSNNPYAASYTNIPTLTNEIYGVHQIETESNFFGTKQLNYTQFKTIQYIQSMMTGGFSAHESMIHFLAVNYYVQTIDSNLYPPIVTNEIKYYDITSSLNAHDHMSSSTKNTTLIQRNLEMQQLSESSCANKDSVDDTLNKLTALAVGCTVAQAAWGIGTAAVPAFSTSIWPNFPTVFNNILKTADSELAMGIVSLCSVGGNCYGSQTINWNIVSAVGSGVQLVASVVLAETITPLLVTTSVVGLLCFTASVAQSVFSHVAACCAKDCNSASCIGGAILCAYNINPNLC